MEFKGIPMGHLYMPDTSTPTMIQKPIKITSYQELDEFMREVSAQHNIDYTDLEDVDDTMDIDLAEMGLVGAITPELPQRDFNIRTITPEKLAELKAAGVEGAEWNATHN